MVCNVRTGRVYRNVVYPLPVTGSHCSRQPGAAKLQAKHQFLC